MTKLLWPMFWAAVMWCLGYLSGRLSQANLYLAAVRDHSKEISSRDRLPDGEDYIDLLGLLVRVPTRLQFGRKKNDEKAR